MPAYKNSSSAKMQFSRTAVYNSIASQVNLMTTSALQSLQGALIFRLN